GGGARRPETPTPNPKLLKKTPYHGEFKKTQNKNKKSESVQNKNINKTILITNTKKNSSSSCKTKILY
ncbi:hypothetical protein, partial [Salmonella enterica]|uniref:hypothetical protein n=1 Tax=Salmonella enterica TaxID=28901 RepID=UPI0020C4950D